MPSSLDQSCLGEDRALRNVHGRASTLLDQAREQKWGPHQPGAGGQGCRWLSSGTFGFLISYSAPQK